MTRHASFAPIVDDNTETLILGSLPGAASLAAGRYYAHPRNQFWRLVGGVIGVDLASLEYQGRLDTLLAYRIGLWDVIADAERVGSLDTAIRNPAPNDLQNLVASLPRLRRIAFNGGTAARIGEAQLGTQAATPLLIRLPSSSPAHAIPYGRKSEAWERLLLA